jgi:preprotein translocase subunit YajC|tara:strand:+ start:220 stop:417 length:198 start_codon:yes stop_codon:yes gene_type:complete
MIFKITLCIVIFVLFMVIFMSIVEGKIRNRQNEKITWRIEEMDKKRDRVVTRTGGLENDRLNERQ